MSIVTLIRSAAIVLLSTLHLGPAALYSHAGGTKPDTGVKSSASASAHASASASAGTGKNDECRAESSAVAEARSGDQVVRDEDQDSAEDKAGGCSAHAESRASAQSGPTD